MKSFEWVDNNAPHRPSQRLTLAGFGAAISVISIILSFYVRPLKLVLRIVTVMGIMLPLTKGYYKEAFLEYIAVVAMGAIFINVKIVTFAVFGGLYTIIAVFLERNPMHIKWYVAYAIRIIYATIVFWILALVINMFFKLSDFGYLWNPYATYFLANLIFIGLFLLYDKVTILAFEKFARIIDRITGYTH